MNARAATVTTSRDLFENILESLPSYTVFPVFLREGAIVQTGIKLKKTGYLISTIKREEGPYETMMSPYGTETFSYQEFFDNKEDAVKHHSALVVALQNIMKLAEGQDESKINKFIRKRYDSEFSRS